MAINKGRSISDDEMSKAAGGYIVRGGAFDDDKVYDSKGEFVESRYFSYDADRSARKRGESTMDVSEGQMYDLRKNGFFDDGNRRYYADGSSKMIQK